MDETLRQLMLQMQLRSLVSDPGVFGRIAVDPPQDNRDMQVRAPGQNQFPNQMFGLLLHPNAAGIYGNENRPPPEGDVVLPSEGYRSARSRNAYMPSADPLPHNRSFDETNIELQKPGTRTDGFRRIDYDPVTQLMLQMQLQQPMGGNQQPIGRENIPMPGLTRDESFLAPDIVLQPGMSYGPHGLSYGQQGYPPPHTGVFYEQSPSLVPIPPSPWNRPNFDPQQGWRSNPNDPVSDDPPGPKYEPGFAGPAERGFIKSSATSDPVTQLMLQMQLQSLMGGNRVPF